MRLQLPGGWAKSLESWQGWMTAAGMSARTIRTRLGHVSAVARASHTRHPSDLTSADLLEIFGTRTYSLEHRRGARTSLNQFYRWAIDNGITANNPAADLPKIAADTPKPKPAPEWLWKELVTTTGPRELLMIRLAGEAGLRREEIAKVHRDDVMWDGSGWALRVNGKGGRQRVVPIGESLAKVLQKPVPWIPPGLQTGWLFPSLDRWGNVIAPHLSADRVGRLISDLMPAGWSAHKLRHRYATRGYAGTKNLRAVQEALGHASVATTQRYTAVSAPEVRAVAEAAAM